MGAGARAAALSIADNAAGSPHTVALSGTGTAVTLTSTGLTFGNQNVGTTSSSQSVTLRNVGSTTLTAVAIAIGGINTSDFARTTTCGATLGANATCTIGVSFTPTATGARAAAVVVTTSDPASPLQIALSGTGTQPVAAVSPTSLAFASQRIYTSSSAQTVTLRNTGTGTLAVSGTTITGANAGDFSRTTTCGSTLSAGSSCSIQVTFRPTATGSRTATLQVADSDPTSPQLVTLTGTGR
jgi:hypothetical protein